MIGSAIILHICKELAMKRRTLLAVLAALPLVVHAQTPQPGSWAPSPDR
jgi:hypothetical protein